MVHMTEGAVIMAMVMTVVMPVAVSMLVCMIMRMAAVMIMWMIVPMTVAMAVMAVVLMLVRVVVFVAHIGILSAYRLHFTALMFGPVSAATMPQSISAQTASARTHPGRSRRW